MSRRLDLISKRFGKLVVLSEADPHTFPGGTRSRRVNAVCDCGSRVTVFSKHIVSGLTTSCGCHHRALVARLKTSHGATRGPRRAWDAEYGIWSGMIARCENPNVAKYESYGGRGVKVCARWRKSYAAFLADMGRRPSKRHSIDRINNDGDYEPTNCRWATASQQMRNRRPFQRRLLKNKTS